MLALEQGARLRTARCVITVALAVALAPGLHAPARAADVAVVLDGDHGACEVHGTFSVPVADSVAWGVLTDYDGIGRFVQSIRSSRVEHGDDGRMLVRQDAVSSMWVFHRHVEVLLALDLDPGRRIGFADVLGKDFIRYVGEWRLATTPDGTRVDYAVAAEPRDALARALCRGALRRTAAELLTQVRAEMLRRGADAMP